MGGGAVQDGEGDREEGAQLATGHRKALAVMGVSEEAPDHTNWLIERCALNFYWSSCAPAGVY